MFRSVLNLGLLVALIAIVGQEAAGADWDYSGVDSWSATFPNCGGSQQSPININTRRTKKGIIKPIAFYNYDVLPTEQTVTNDGHTIKVEISSITKTPYISWRGGLWFYQQNKYIFAQYHLHWGSVSSQGSEHTINSVRFPMELHLVHYNDKYSDLTAAVSESDGLAVLGIMFTISKNDNPALAPLLAAMTEVQNYTSSDPDTVSKTNLYALSSLLPSNTRRFYRYDGSLTTPTCDESVLWTVFEKPIKISESQMEEFRKVIGSHGSSSDNYRPVQDLNGRKVERSFK